MKYLFLVIFLLGCGTEYNNRRNNPGKNINWKSVAKIHINAAMSTGYNLAPTITNITYTSAQVNNFSLDTGSLAAGSEVDASLDLGSLDVSTLVLNNLDQCGAGTERCTSARIAVYTTELASYTGISGFVNTDDSYGVPVIVSATTGGATGTVGLGSANAYGAETIDISSTSIRRINRSNFTTGPYLITSDFSNAGVGNYEMDLVVDLQLGN